MSVSSPFEMDNLATRQQHFQGGASGTTAYQHLEQDDYGDHTASYKPNGDQAAGFDTSEMRDVDLSNETDFRKLGNQAFIRNAAINGVLIGLWYFFSISISVYNKWMFSSDNLDFHFPLFTTAGHMLIQFFLACTVLYFFPHLRPQNAVLHNKEASQHDRNQPPPEPRDPNQPLMTPWFYLTRIVSTGAVTGLDIGLGNTSLIFITLTFFSESAQRKARPATIHNADNNLAMCKSSTLGFVLAFAIVFKLEKPSWKIGAIILVMTIGVVMMVAGETAFNGIGFALLMAASFFSGLRWSLTQILLLRTAATSNPFATLFFLTPVMFFTLLLLAFPLEGVSELKHGLDVLAEAKGTFVGLVIILVPGILAFLMTASEFALLQRTSVVTLSVCGIFKEVLTISAAGLVFGDTLTTINISGLLITICAIAAYNFIRMKKMQKKAIIKAQEQNFEERAPMLGQDVVPGAGTGINDDAVQQTGIRSRASSTAPNAHMASQSAPLMRKPEDGHEE